MNACWHWEKVYNIKENTPITLDHVISILLYTNFSKLCYEFSRTYREISNNESDKEMRKRHSEYAVWGRLLRETCEVYGTLMQDSKIKSFYTGISSLMLFNSFCVNICCPLSTAAS